MRCKCLKCDFEWNSRKEEPRACPKCKNYEWREPRKRAKWTYADNKKTRKDAV